MILVDTSVYIAAVDDVELERLLEELSQKFFVHSCDVVEKEIHNSSEFLRKTERKEKSERLKLIYDKIREGTIRTTERIDNLAQEYHNESDLSKNQHKDIKNDFLIVASASVAGIKKIFSFNRKTMCSEGAILAYNTANKRKNYRTPEFLTSRDKLSQLLKLP